MEGGGGYILRDEMPFFSKQISKEAERAEAALPVKTRLVGFLASFLVGFWPADFIKCVKEEICVDGIPVFGEDLRIVFVRSGSITREFFYSWDGNDVSLNLPEA